MCCSVGGLFIKSSKCCGIGSGLICLCNLDRKVKFQSSPILTRLDSANLRLLRGTSAATVINSYMKHMQTDRKREKERGV